MDLYNGNLLKENKNLKTILEFIDSRNLSIDERLPSERELASEIGISRSSLREALKILQTLGIVEIKSNSGVYLRKKDFNPKKENAVFWLIVNKKQVINMLTVRETLDLRAIELIPEHMYPQMREELKAAIEKVKASPKTHEDMMAHDLAFHNIIRKASDNEILYNICNALTGNMYDERKALYLKSTRIEKSIQEHNRIANAFGSGNVNEVKLAYTEHLTSTRFSIESLEESES